jgi:hypothetical protein
MTKTALKLPHRIDRYQPSGCFTRNAFAVSVSRLEDSDKVKLVDPVAHDES